MAAAPTAEAATPRRTYEFQVPGKVVEVEEYGGPILAGQRWRSRGTAGHNTYPVVVLRHSAGGKVVFQSHKPGRRADGRQHSLDEPAFRRRYALEKQAPGARGVAVLEAVVAIAHGRSERQPPETQQTREQERRMDAVDAVVDSLNRQGSARPEGGPPGAASPPAAAPPGNGVLPHARADGSGAFEGRSPGRAGAVDDLPTEPLAETPPPEPAPEPEADLLEAFLIHGRATLERLGQDLRRLEEDRELARLELEELDGRLATTRAQGDKIERAIRAALAVAEGASVVALGAGPAPLAGGPAFLPAPPEVTAPAPDPFAPEAVADTGFAPVTRPATQRAAPLEGRAVIEPPARRPGPARGRTPVRRQAAHPVAKGAQFDWFQERLAGWPPRKPLTSGALAPDFARTFGFDELPYATDRVMTLITKWVKRPRAGLRLERIARGQYRVVREGAPPEPPPEPVPARAAPAPGTQKAWLEARLAEQRLWTIRDLVGPFADAFGLAHEAARKNLGSVLSEWAKPGLPGGPKVVRLGPGLYEAAGWGG
jgi:hypothetical protein